MLFSPTSLIAFATICLMTNAILRDHKSNDKNNWIFYGDDPTGEEAAIQEILKAHADRRFEEAGRNATHSRLKRMSEDIERMLFGRASSYLNTGMKKFIERTTERTKEMMSHSDVSGYGCKWTGYAPLCSDVHKCPSDYDFVRRHNGRCSERLFAGICIPDHSFGKPCFNLLGEEFQKRLCCKSAPGNCEWNGRWMAAKMGYNFYCSNIHDASKCGSLVCHVNDGWTEHRAYDVSLISGRSCDTVNLFGHNGKATCGFIAWFDKIGELADSWYKAET